MRFFPSRVAPSILLAFLALLPTTASSTPVEVSHPVTNLLRRLEEKGVIRPGFWSTLPREESEVAGALSAALQKPYAKNAVLSSWDRRRVESYLEEFDPERRWRNTRLRFADSVFTVRGHAEFFTGGYLRDSLPTAEGYTFGSFTPGVEATYRERLYLSAQAMVGMERNRNGRFIENFDPQRGMPYGTGRDGKPIPGIPQPVSTFDGFRTLIGFGDGRLAIEAGQDWNQWGPGHWQHTTLGTRPYFWAADSLEPDSAAGFAGTGTNFWQSRRGYRVPGEGPPLPQIRIRLGGGRWEYVKIVAKRTGLSSDSSAYLIAHRGQLRLGSWKIGVMELLSIGNRSPDMLLLVPGIPLKFAEHSGGDLDNSAVAADVEWTWIGHGRAYGELFVDDYSGPPLNFRGNKFAVVLGGSFQDPFGLPTELHAEYASVDPWTYGHHLYNTAMQHDGALLGSSLPPNSRSVSLSAEFPLPRSIEGTAEWHFRQRDLKSRGASIFDVYNGGRLPIPTEKEFLEVDIETRNTVEFAASWQWKRYATVKGGAGGLWVNNWRGNPGTSLATPTVFSEVTLRY